MQCVFVSVCLCALECVCVCVGRAIKWKGMKLSERRTIKKAYVLANRLYIHLFDVF